MPCRQRGSSGPREARADAWGSQRHMIAAAVDAVSAVAAVKRSRAPAARSSPQCLLVTRKGHNTYDAKCLCVCEIAEAKK